MATRTAFASRSRLRLPRLAKFRRLSFTEWYALALRLAERVAAEVDCGRQLAEVEVLRVLDELRRTFQPLPPGWPIIEITPDPLADLWRRSTLPRSYRLEIELFGWALIPLGLRQTIRSGRTSLVQLRSKARTRAQNALDRYREERRRAGDPALVRCQERVESLLASLAVEAVRALEREGALLATRPTYCSSGKQCAGLREGDGVPPLVMTPAGNRGRPWTLCSACLKEWEHGVQYRRRTEELQRRYRVSTPGKAWLRYRRGDWPLVGSRRKDGIAPPT